MTEEKTKILLKEYRDLMPEVQELNNELNKFIKIKSECMDTLKAATISDMPISHSTTSDPVFELVSRYDTEISQYTNKINELIDKKKLIEKMLFQLEPIEKRIVEYKYIYNPNYRCDIWKWIGDKIGYEERQVRRIFDRAIEKMTKWYNT